MVKLPPPLSKESRQRFAADQAAYKAKQEAEKAERIALLNPTQEQILEAGNQALYKQVFDGYRTSKGL
jgi:hypothetical protein